MTSETTGCLHDYQITSKDMKLLSTADTLIINGGGMEPFIDEITSTYKSLPIIDSSKDIELLSSQIEHSHDHSEDKDKHKDESKKDYKANHNHGEYNSHIWLDPDNYIKQISTITNRLCEIYPEYTDTFTSNSKSYIKDIKELKSEIKNVSKDKKEPIDVILFHESFVYLNDSFNLNTINIINIDDDTALSAGTIADVISEIKHHDIKVMIIESQFKENIADSISKETDAKVYTLDPLVSGKDLKDAYIKGMKHNISTLEQIIKDL